MNLLVHSAGWIISTIRLFSPIDIGVIAGIDYAVTKELTIEARYKQGFSDAINQNYFDDDYSDNDQNNTTQVFQLGLAYKFDLKK